MTDPEELLDIKQAASLLRVSETSLRRWTVDGRLPCFRVGGRRERRFRRADLMALLVGNGQTEQSDAMQLRPVSEPHGMHAGNRLSHQNHDCAFYSSGSERMRQAADYLAVGLLLGSVCFLAATSDVRDAVLDRLAIHRHSLKEDIETGRLVLSEYASSAVSQIEYWESSFIRAMRGGASALRVVGDVTSARFTIDPTIEDAIEYEEAYERRLVGRFPVTTLCQYDVRGLVGVDVLQVLASHHHQLPAWQRAGSSVA